LPIQTKAGFLSAFIELTHPGLEKQAEQDWAWQLLSMLP
jgi:hypothetical protein